jgi:hypothetical protein
VLGIRRCLEAPRKFAAHSHLLHVVRHGAPRSG